MKLFELNALHPKSACPPKKGMLFTLLGQGTGISALSTHPPPTAKAQQRHRELFKQTTGRTGRWNK